MKTKVLTSFLSLFIIVLFTLNIYAFSSKDNIYIKTELDKIFFVVLDKEDKEEKEKNIEDIILTGSIIERKNKLEIEISFLGDVMIWWRVREAMEENWVGYVFTWSQDYLVKKDAIVLNLETPVTETWKKMHKKYVFNAKREHLFWLKTWNKNIIVNLSNNHIWDFWEEGMKNTFANLHDYWIWYFWAWANKKEADEARVFEIEWVKIWLIWQVCIWPKVYEATEVKPWNSFFNKKVLKIEIDKIRKDVDLIVFNMHCWEEYKNWPNWKQTEYARYAIDSWVDLVIWHHPHWYQPVEIYKWKAIFYSLWNYVFDIFRSKRTQEWIIANVVIKDKKIKEISIVPVWYTNFWNTKILWEIDKKRVLNEIYNLSKRLWEIEWLKEWLIKLK